ncbi:MAG: sugar-binding protein [Draconibacterium sp.]
MKIVFTLFLNLILCSMVMGQSLTAVIKKAEVAPQIDGIVDEVWAKAPELKIERVLQSDTPDIGESTWQALWDFDGLYILIKIDDDAFYPGYIAGSSEDWNYDLPGFSIDVNPILEDGVGSGAGSATGHYGFGPIFSKSTDNKLITEPSGFQYFHNVIVPNYIAEFFVPFSMLKDQFGNDVNIAGVIGFDVNIIDRDPGDPKRGIAVWSNSGEKDENYNNMDDAGHITLEGADGLILIERISLPNGSISTDNGTLQLIPNFEPENASNKKLKWSVKNGTGIATISSTGLLTAVKNGTVTVTAEAVDGSWAETSAEISISGQIIDNADLWNMLNLIKNYDFSEDASTFWTAGWIDAGAGEMAVSEEGAAKLVTHVTSDIWRYQFTQNGFKAEPNVPYLFKFKAWATGDRYFTVDFEDTPENSYTRYGASPDSTALGGRSEWLITVNSTPTWFIQHVTFDKILPTTVEKCQFMVANSEETLYLDSILLVKESDYNLVTDVKTNYYSNSIKVYPNPVGEDNLLNVKTGIANTSVAIYNTSGQKLIEKTANGNLVKFDVENLRKGLYIIRLSDGTSAKFIK